MNNTNIKISLAHLSSRVKQGLVAVLSVTFGISMYVFMNSFMTGVNDAQTDLAFSTLAHVRVYNDLPEDHSDLISKGESGDPVVHLRNARVIQYTEGIKNSRWILEYLRNQPQVVAVSSQVNVNVFFRNGASKVNGILSGIEPIGEDQLFGLADYMNEGSWFDLGNQSNGAILGAGLAHKLSLNVNDQVLVTTGDGVSKHFRVIGIIETTLSSVDNSKAYINISSARQLISENQSYVTDIQVNMQDYNDARSLGEEWGRVIPYKVEAWQQANGQLEAANELRNIIAVAVSLTILIVAGFGIYNIMNMTVNEKIKEIAILKAMGFQGGDIVQIFLVQSLIIGFAGGVVGALLGNVVSSIVNRVPFHIATLDTLPMAYRVVDYVMAFSFGLIITFIAGYLPARKASLVDPVSIIRG